MIAVLCGGVGAARYLSGLVQVLDPTQITAIVNTGDDLEAHGLNVCPDLDTVTYTLAGLNDTERGWGLRDETFRTIDALGRFGVPTWFRLGDQDLGTHLYRTQRLREGASLTAVTREIAHALGVRARVLPMSDEPVRTRVQLEDGEEVSFQEYFVKLHFEVVVRALRFANLENARPSAQVIEALEGASRIVIAPSNPYVSIGPILALAGVRELLTRRRRDVVAISPIVGGKALKGPADRLLVELGASASAPSVAALFRDIAGTFILDRVDAQLQPAVESLGMHVRCTDTVMSSPEVAASLARLSLEQKGEAA